MLYSNFLLAIYITHGKVDISMLLSQIIPPSSSPAVFTSLFSMSTFLLLLQIDSPEPFSRFYINELIYDICFSLPDLLPFAQQALGSPTSV